MYTVTCSACGQAEKSLFARVGAVMVCGGCKAKVALRAEDVKRQFKIRTDVDEELFRVPQVHREEPPAPIEAEAGSAEMSESIHEDHAELAVEAERRAEAARKRKPKGQAIVKAGMSSGELAQHLAKKRRAKTAGVLVAVGVLVVAGVVFIISAASNGRPSGTDGTKDTAIKAGTTDGSGKDGGASDGGAKDGAIAVVPPIKDGLKDGVKDKSVASKDGTATPPEKDKDKKTVVPPPAAMVRVTAMPLGIDEWQTVSEAYRSAPVDGSVMLVDETNEKQDTGEQLFKARIVCRDGVASALVSVTLVNDEDRVYAKFERPFYLLEGKKARPMTLVIPKELVSSGTSVYWTVQPIDTHVKNATLLEDTLAEVLKAEGKPVLKVSAYNPSDRGLKDAAFVIQALNGAGQITSQWRLKFPQEVGAKSWAKFEAELSPVDVKAVATWRVLGAGIPSGDAAAPPPPLPPEERDPREPVRPRGRGLFDF
jgi:hypothetical protein